MVIEKINDEFRITVRKYFLMTVVALEKRKNNKWKVYHWKSLGLATEWGYDKIRGLYRILVELE